MRFPAILLTLCAALGATAFCFVPAGTQELKSKVLFEEPDPARAQRELDELAQQGKASGGKPIYDKDDRMDWGAIRDRRVQAVALASVALISKNFLDEQDGKLRLNAYTLEDKYNLCPGQRFLKQLSGSFCSGVLVTEDMVATAGHCIAEVAPVRGAVPLRDMRFVFGYTAGGQQEPGRSLFDKPQVFSARALIGGKNDAREDWALVRLDRPVPREIAEPVKKISKTRIADKEAVFVVGYPSGLPMKYAPGADVVKNEGDSSFIANLDTFGGNSGAGVFAAKTNELVGILVSGETDYHRSKTARCNEAYLCPRYGCSGEKVTRIETVVFP